MTVAETTSQALPTRKGDCGGCGDCCCCPPNDPHAAALAVLGRDNSPLRLQGFTVTTTTTTRYGFAAPGSDATSRVAGVARQVGETLDEEVEAEVASGLTDKLKEAAEQSPALLALLRGDLDQAAEIGGLLGGDLGASLAAMLVEVVEERKTRADAEAEAAAEPPPEIPVEVTGPAPPTPPPQPPPAPPPGSGLGI